MTSTRATVFAAATLAATLAGCLSPRTAASIPQFEMQPALAVTAVAPSPYTLAIRPLMVASPYTAQMAYLDKDQRFGYRNEEWVEAPGAMLSRALRDAIAASNRFKDTGSAGDLARPDFILTGELRKFHEDRTQAQPTTVCELRLELRPALKKGVIWAKTLNASVPIQTDEAKNNTAPAIAKAMSAAVSQVVNQAAAAIATAPLPPPLQG